MLKGNFLKTIIGLVIVLVASPFFMFGQSKQSAHDALEIKADTLLNQQDYEGAVKLYSSLVKKSKLKRESDFTFLYKRAYCFYSLQQYDEALADLNRYLKNIPNDQARILRLYTNQSLGDVDAQLEDLNILLQKNPERGELLQWRLSLLMDSEKYKEAQHDIRNLLSTQDDQELQAYLGLTHYYLENIDSAFAIFDQLVEQQPTYIQTYLFAGSISLEEEEYDASLYYINKGLRVEPDNATLLFYKGIALVEKEDLIEGCRCLNKAFSKGMDDAGEYLDEYCYGESD